MDAKLVANYITTLKEKSGLTDEIIAENSGRSVATVKNLRSGKTEDPRLDTVAPVIYALGGSIDEMYTGKKDAAKEISIASIKEMY
jgi:transcriptional regulator with XRE-family HTH domain